MKHLLTAIVLFISLQFSAQDISSEIKYAIQNDASKALEKEITKDNLNQCFSIGNSEYTLLNLTIKYNSKNCFKLLLKEKVNVNNECNGKTSLIYAAKYGHLEIAKLLIKAGADVKKEYRGRTALDYALKYKKDSVYTYLKSL